MQYPKKRLHDEIYLKKEDRSSYKQSFYESLDIINEFLPSVSSEIDLIDIGSSNGEFLELISTSLPLNTIRLSAADIRSDLLDVCRERLEDSKITLSNYYLLDISSSESCNQLLSLRDGRGFDVIHMSGVHGIFDNLSWLSNLFQLVNANGLIIIFGAFSDSNYNLYVSAEDYRTNVHQSGWNRMSIHGLNSEIQKNKDVDNVIIKDFNLDSPIPQSDDPFRVHTQETSDGRYIQLMQVGLVTNQKFVVIRMR